MNQLHHLNAFLLVLLLALPFLSIITDRGSATTTELLMKGNTPGEFFDLDFPPGGGRDSSVSIYIPDSGPVISSSLLISTVEGAIGPESVFLDVGSDERQEWKYGGGEEGGFGLQHSFVNGKKVVRDHLDRGGVINSLYLPQGADIGSSRIRISSPPSPEAEGMRKFFKMEHYLLPVDTIDAGDIDNDGELELIFFDPDDDCIYAVDIREGSNSSLVKLAGDVPGVTTLTSFHGQDDGSHGVIFSRTENGASAVGMLLGGDLENMKLFNLSSGLPANSSGYSYNRDTGNIYILSGPSGRVLRASTGDRTVTVEEVLDSSITASAITEADLDGDGDHDLLIFPEVSSGQNITICRSNVQEASEVLTLDDSGISFSSGSVGTALDIDGDGKEEIYISLGPHGRIASFYLDASGEPSIKWIGLNNTNGRPRSLSRSAYGNGSIYAGSEGMLCISTYDGLYHVLPRDGPSSEHIWRKSVSFSSLALIGEVENGYRAIAIEKDNYLSICQVRWSSGSEVFLGSVVDDIGMEIDLDPTGGRNVSLDPLIMIGEERPMKTTPSGNILIRYDMAVKGFNGFFSMTDLRIDYDVVMDASHSTTFRPAIQKVVDTSGLTDVPITVRTTSEGIVRIGPVNVRYDSPPEVLPDLPRSVIVKEGAPRTVLFNIRDHIQDDDLLPQGLDVEMVHGPDLPPGMLIFDWNGDLVAQPFMFPDLNGQFSFAIKVSDLRNTVQTDALSLVVEPTPDPPVLVGGIDEITITEGEVTRIKLAGEEGMFTDPDGDILDFTYSIASPQPITLRDAMDIQIKDGIMELLANISGCGGSFRLEILASDGSQESDPGMGVIKVNVINMDAHPALGRNPGPVILIEDQDTPSRIPLSGWFMDPDSRLSDYTFNVFSPNKLLEASIRDPGGEPYLNLHPKGDLNGEFSLMIEMTGEGTNILDRLIVDITPVNDVPQVFMDGKDLLENRGWLINGHVSDPDSDDGRVEYRIGDGVWKKTWGFESWSMIIDFRDMPTGSAFVFIRAFDGNEYSLVTYIKLTRPEDPPEPLTNDPDPVIDDEKDPEIPG
ncbi:MAG: hypothetical protein JW939_09495, partial [Candidatus Thermoplasmatota archaeon]|nr:hypothetical protein [Candidatus Thermoplasmatota archaeon]